MKPMALADCPVCARLPDESYAATYVAHPEEDSSLPGSVNALVRVENDPQGTDFRHIKRCTACGTCYDYHYTHDYYVNGSEDSEELRRMTPTQARRLHDDATYAELLARAHAQLAHADLNTRRHAARSVADDLLAKGRTAELADLLVRSDDETVRGVLMLLYWRSEDHETPPAADPRLVAAFESVAARGDKHLVAVCKPLLKWLKRT